MKTLSVSMVLLLSVGIVLAASKTFDGESEGLADASSARAPGDASGWESGDLEALFAAAARSPEEVVPLLLAGSAQLEILEGERRHDLAQRLDPFARRAFFSPERLPGMERLGLALHKVRSGEIPGRIARKYRIGHGLLPFLNAGFEPRRLRVGQELKVVDLSDEGLRVEVDRGAFRVTVSSSVPGGGRVLVLHAAVGLGADESPTPVGATRIVDRALDPPWTDPKSGVTYAPDDPGNVLGGFWIRLDAAGIGEDGIGFHGYTAEATERWLGKARSSGCVRMRQLDVEHLFYIALEGTPVRIVR